MTRLRKVLLGVAGSNPDRVVGNPTSPDRGRWLHGARVCEALEGAKRIRRNSARTRSTGTPRHGMGDGGRRVGRRFRSHAGAFVWAVSLPMAVVLVVAMFTVHLPYGFSSIKLVAVTAAGAQFGPPGYETVLLYIACLAALILGGARPLSIDGLIAQRRDAHSRVGALEGAADRGVGTRRLRGRRC